MQGISRSTAYEIEGNPKDIVVSFGGPDKKTGKFVGWITRGEGHNFRPLLNTQPIYDTPKQAKQAMKDLIAQIREFVKKDLKNPENPLKGFFSEPVS